jgi:hypothetical protein
MINGQREGKKDEEFGGILLSPPDDKGRVKKFHLCPKCYHEIVGAIGKK